jgi:hypothetical protein
MVGGMVNSLRPRRVALPCVEAMTNVLYCRIAAMFGKFSTTVNAAGA